MTLSGTVRRKRILLICGSHNQTTMMHEVGTHLGQHHCAYSSYYSDGLLRWFSQRGYLDTTVLGVQHRARANEYLRRHRLTVDEGGKQGNYDLVVTCSDLLVQRNVRGKPLVLVQEGMTDPENLTYHLVRALGLPRWLASTSTTGLSLAYSKFCVASAGYREFFQAKGIPEGRLVVTGIPNFDNCASFLRNDFPHRGYVLVATSDTRETFKRDDRRRFFSWVEGIARGRPLLFKLHPNENAARSTSEIQSRFSDALVLASGNTNHMIANCEALVTQYSSVVYVGLALGKECHSYFDLAELKRLLPWQNGGSSGRNIASVCASMLREQEDVEPAAWSAAS
jgi:hypothetical protein